MILPGKGERALLAAGESRSRVLMARERSPGLWQLFPDPKLVAGRLPPPVRSREEEAVRYAAAGVGLWEFDVMDAEWLSDGLGAGWFVREPRLKEVV